MPILTNHCNSRYFFKASSGLNSQTHSKQQLKSFTFGPLFFWNPQICAIFLRGFFLPFLWPSSHFATFSNWHFFRIWQNYSITVSLRNQFCIFFIYSEAKFVLIGWYCHFLQIPSLLCIPCCRTHRCWRSWSWWCWLWGSRPNIFCQPPSHLEIFGPIEVRGIGWYFQYFSCSIWEDRLRVDITRGLLGELLGGLVSQLESYFLDFTFCRKVKISTQNPTSAAVYAWFPQKLSR
jgi:hypothetical protein